MIGLLLGTMPICCQAALPRRCSMPLPGRFGVGRIAVRSIGLVRAGWVGGAVLVGEICIRLYTTNGRQDKSASHRGRKWLVGLTFSTSPKLGLLAQPPIFPGFPPKIRPATMPTAF